MEYADLALNVNGEKMKDSLDESAILKSSMQEASGKLPNGASPEFAGSMSLRGHIEDTVNL